MSDKARAYLLVIVLIAIVFAFVYMITSDVPAPREQELTPQQQAMIDKANAGLKAHHSKPIRKHIEQGPKWPMDK